MSTFTIGWRARTTVLEPRAVAAVGSVARALIAQLASAPRAGLTGVASRDVAVILGERAQLPWLDGVEYLGLDPRAPRLLLPTTDEPVLRAGSLDVPAPLDVLEQRLASGDVAPPIAVLRGRVLVSLADARALDPAVLRAWLAEAT